MVPLDGSEFAERALRPACALAARLDDACLLLVCCSPDDTAAARAYLDDRASLFAAAVDVDTRILDEGRPADGILRLLSVTPDALLCIATHGHGGFRTAVLGSVTERVVRSSSEPLVLVGPACRTVLLAGERGRLLVCSDGSAFSDAIVPAAASWAARLQLEPWVAEVVGPEEDVAVPGGPVRNRQVEAASARLDQLALGLRTPPAWTKVLHGTPASRSIVDFAGRLPASLIALATHGRTGLARSAVGSVTAEIVRHAPCPVLVTRPGPIDES
ncbi:MAG: universal stress protein [Acidimicrobiales bacterium]